MDIYCEVVGRLPGEHPVVRIAGRAEMVIQIDSRATPQQIAQGVQAILRREAETRWVYVGDCRQAAAS